MSPHDSSLKPEPTTLKFQIRTDVHNPWHVTTDRHGHTPRPHTRPHTRHTAHTLPYTAIPTATPPHMPIYGHIRPRDYICHTICQAMSQNPGAEEPQPGYASGPLGQWFRLLMRFVSVRERNVTLISCEPYSRLGFRGSGIFLHATWIATPWVSTLRYRCVVAGGAKPGRGQHHR